MRLPGSSSSPVPAAGRPGRAGRPDVAGTVAGEGRVVGVRRPGSGCRRRAPAAARPAPRRPRRRHRRTHQVPLLGADPERAVAARAGCRCGCSPAPGCARRRTPRPGAVEAHQAVEGGDPEIAVARLEDLGVPAIGSSSAAVNTSWTNRNPEPLQGARPRGAVARPKVVAAKLRRGCGKLVIGVNGACTILNCTKKEQIARQNWTSSKLPYPNHLDRASTRAALLNWVCPRKKTGPSPLRFAFERRRNSGAGWRLSNPRRATPPQPTSRGVPDLPRDLDNQSVARSSSRSALADPSSSDSLRSRRRRRGRRAFCVGDDGGEVEAAPRRNARVQGCHFLRRIV